MEVQIATEGVELTSVDNEPQNDTKPNNSICMIQVQGQIKIRMTLFYFPVDDSKNYLFTYIYRWVVFNS